MEATRDCEAFAAEESLLNGVPDFEERYQAHLDSCPVCREKLDRALADEQLLDTARRIGDPTVVPLEPAVAEVVEHTGFEFDRPPHVPVTPAPSLETLRILLIAVAPRLAEVYPQFAAQVFGVGNTA